MRPRCLPISPFPLYQKSSEFDSFLPYLDETPPPAYSFYPLCLPCQCDSDLRLFALNNCLVINPNCSHFLSIGNKLHLPHHASSISFPVPQPPNPQVKSFYYPTSSKHHNIKLKSHPGNSQTHQVSLSRFPNRLFFLNF